MRLSKITLFDILGYILSRKDIHMTKMVQGIGKATGGIEITFEYPDFEGKLANAVDYDGSEEETCRHRQRMAKVDARNAKAAEYAPSVTMTEEQKAKAKAKRASDASILKILAEKGITTVEEAKEYIANL